MTIEEAKEYIPDFKSFYAEACAMCAQEWYCPHNCEILDKARKMDFNRILKCYARHDGEMYKVLRWLKQARI